jgi:signal transduction histidine kinase
MIEFFQKLFVSNDFMPHGHCYLWQPSIIGLHVVSDAIIVLAYYSIPIMLVYFVQKRQDVPFHWMFVMFGAFIFGCGTTHLMGIWTVWTPAYRLEGVIKLLTALISIATALLLIPVIPKALDLPSLKLSNDKLKKSTEDLLRSNRDLEQFAYVASHDLQEPLRMVTGYVQLLEKRYKGKLDPDAEGFIREAVEGTRRMQSMISDLLAFSRIAQGNEFESVSSEQAFENALANLQIAVRESGTVVTRGDLPVVTGDFHQIIQLFQNLIGNALKFRGKEPPRIHVEALGREGEWVFSVRDNGIGLSPQYADQIFLMFRRLHTKDEYSGTGIGLTVCKRIVERHGGRIWVESEEGKGACFYFTIPDSEKKEDENER